VEPAAARRGRAGDRAEYAGPGALADHAEGSTR
jgi:hypothetical protein